MLSGYYKAYYLVGDHVFSASKEFIQEVLNRAISFVENYSIPHPQTMHCQYQNEWNEFIRKKSSQQQQTEAITIMYNPYPLQKQMNVSLFGLNSMVHNAKNQLKRLINRHRMRTIRIALDLKQVRIFTYHNRDT